MSYDINDISKNLLLEWDGDDFYVLRYVPYRTGRMNEATRLILDFKEGRVDAIKIVTDLLIETLKDQEKEFRYERKCKYIVSVPPSTAGEINGPCERVCSNIAKTFGWLSHLPEALERTETVQKSARAKPGERPDYTNHLRTIRYKGPYLHKIKDTIIMLDDVITRKKTSNACREILKNSTGCKQVIGFYLGRTLRTLWN